MQKLMFDHLEEMRCPSLPASGWTWEAEESVPWARIMCFVSHTTFVLLRFDVGKVGYGRERAPCGHPQGKQAGTRSAPFRKIC